jgi:putative transposase
MSLLRCFCRPERLTAFSAEKAQAGKGLSLTNSPRRTRVPQQTISKNHAVVFVEDLQVQNMSASSKGTKAKPGKRVIQKSGLNRAILDARPFELRRQLEYQTEWRGGLLVSVPPQNTSRKCPECQHIAAENRNTQAKFVCAECGFSAHADFVGAVNMKEAGLALLGCQLGPAARETL